LRATSLEGPASLELQQDDADDDRKHRDERERPRPSVTRRGDKQTKSGRKRKNAGARYVRADGAGERFSAGGA